VSKSQAVSHSPYAERLRKGKDNDSDILWDGRFSIQVCSRQHLIWLMLLEFKTTSPVDSSPRSKSWKEGHCNVGPSSLALQI